MGLVLLETLAATLGKSGNFKQCNYATIKTNTNTSTQKDIIIDGCTFENNVRGNLTGFNTPNAVQKNVRIVNSNFIRETSIF